MTKKAASNGGQFAADGWRCEGVSALVQFTCVVVYSWARSGVQLTLQEEMIGSSAQARDAGFLMHRKSFQPLQPFNNSLGNFSDLVWRLASLAHFLPGTRQLAARLCNSFAQAGRFFFLKIINLAIHLVASLFGFSFVVDRETNGGWFACLKNPFAKLQKASPK